MSRKLIGFVLLTAVILTACSHRGKVTRLLASERQKLETLSDQLSELPELRFISSGDPLRWINEQQCLTRSDDALDGQFLSVDEALNQLGVDPAPYNRVMETMETLGIWNADNQSAYQVFTFGGFLDNTYGLIYVRSGGDPPTVGTRVAWDFLSTIERVDEHWYFYTTS